MRQELNHNVSVLPSILLTSKDLFGDLGPETYTADVSRTFRQRVGDALLLRREQHKQWSRREAGKQMRADAGTIKAMEQGANAGWDYFERYAEILDTTFEQILRDAMNPVGKAELAASPEGEAIARIYSQLRDVNSRRLLLEMAERFRAAEPPQPATADSSQGSAAASQETAAAESPRIRRTRGA
jgi:ribosomal protein L12E/L44/L45/RPP1/RPP2